MTWHILKILGIKNRVLLEKEVFFAQISFGSAQSRIIGTA
jgi:hypothetical protein